MRGSSIGSNVSVGGNIKLKVKIICLTCFFKDPSPRGRTDWHLDIHWSSSRPAAGGPEGKRTTAYSSQPTILRTLSFPIYVSCCYYLNCTGLRLLYCCRWVDRWTVSALQCAGCGWMRAVVSVALRRWDSFWIITCALLPIEHGVRQCLQNVMSQP